MTEHDFRSQKISYGGGVHLKTKVHWHKKNYKEIEEFKLPGVPKKAFPQFQNNKCFSLRVNVRE